MDLSQQAEMTERGRKSAQNKHAETAALKLEAANEYAKIKSQYRSKKEAARHLHNMFGKVAFSTYLKWVSQWP
jgi:hypothetical protein